MTTQRTRIGSTGPLSLRYRFMTAMALCVIALITTACDTDAEPSDTIAPTTSSPTDSTTTSTPDGSQIDWSDPTKSVELGDGFTIAACAGEAPLLCVERNGEPVGIVEAQRFSTDSLTFFDPAADDSVNLAALADDFISVFRADRAEGCGDDYRLNPVAVGPAVVAGEEGIVFGFEGRLASGDSSELNLHYATIVDGNVVSLAANAYDDGGCPGPDGLGEFDSATLVDFRPHLEALLRTIPLPTFA